MEVFQGDAWSGGTTAAAEMMALYAVTCSARVCPALPIEAKDIEAVRTAIEALTAQWRAVSVGKSLTLEL